MSCRLLSRLIFSLVLSCIAVMAVIVTVHGFSPARAEVSARPLSDPLQINPLRQPLVISTVQLSARQSHPGEVGVNPKTGYVYVGNNWDNSFGDLSVLVLSGPQIITNIVIDHPYPIFNEYIAVNSTTGYVYVAHNGYLINGLAVLSGTQVITDFGIWPNIRYEAVPIKGIAVNESTGYAYIWGEDYWAGFLGYSPVLAVLSGTQVITYVQSITRNVDAVGINKKTGYIYVLNGHSNDVTVLSGTQVITHLAVGTAGSSAPIAIGVNDATGYVYVSDFDGNDVAVLSGTKVIAKLAVASPGRVTVNPVNGYVYIADFHGDGVTVLSSTQVITHLSSLQLLRYPYYDLYHDTIRVDSTTGLVYANGVYTSGNAVYRGVIVLSGTQVISTIVTGGVPAGIGVNPVTSYVYQTNQDGINVILGTRVASSWGLTLTFPTAIGINTTTGNAYVASDVSDDVVILSGTQAITAVKVGSSPQAIAVNSANGYVYVENMVDSNVAVLSDTQVITRVPISNLPDRAMIDVNPTTRYVYVPNQAGMLVLSGTEVVTNFAWPQAGHPYAIAVNPTSGYVYVPHKSTNWIAVMSGTQLVTRIDVLGPCAVAVNPKNNYAYVVSGPGDTSSETVTVFSGVQVIGQLPVSRALCVIGVNPVTGYAYVPYQSDTGMSLLILSGTQIITQLAGIALSPSLASADPNTDCIYFGDDDNQAIGLVCDTQYMGKVAVTGSPWAVAVNPTNGLAYVANHDGHSVSIIRQMVVPGSPTPSYLLSTTDDIVIDFGEPMLTPTIQITIDPPMPITTTWSAALDQVVILHEPFQPLGLYTVHILPEGVAASGIPVAEQLFHFSYAPYRIFLPTLRKNS